MERHEIERLERQFLVHSFIYYVCNDSIISDDRYDAVCRDLLKGLKMPEAEGTSYYDLCRNVLDESMSGYKIKKYPPEIITTALRLLYHHKQPQDRDFEGFIAQWGYSLV
jgi:hypothetical protein